MSHLDGFIDGRLTRIVVAIADDDNDVTALLINELLRHGQVDRVEQRRSPSGVHFAEGFRQQFAIIREVLQKSSRLIERDDERFIRATP